MTVFLGIITAGDVCISHFQSEIESSFNSITNSSHSFESKTERSLFIAYDANPQSTNKGSNSENNYLGWISGEALIQDSENCYVADEVQCVTKHFTDNNLSSILSKSRGVFSGFCIDKAAYHFSIFTDKLGVRPVYIYKDDKVTVFSSVLSILKSLSFVDLSYSSEHAAVFSGLGFCLGNKTPYKYITRIDSGEIVDVDASSGVLQTKSNSYWSFAQDVKVKSETTDDDLAELYEIFKYSVFLRNKNNKSAVSFLSGGMDSRAVTAMVNQFVDSQTTYNYSKNNSQDQFFAREYALRAKLQHNEKSFERLAFPNWSMLIADSINAKNPSETHKMYKRVWSGDGGSVGFGMVYITKNIESCLLNKKYEEAIRQLIQNIGAFIPFSFINENFIVENNDFLFNKIMSSIDFYENDPVKSVYEFLLYNDQKRHMELHFETICQHGVEMMLPFFDSEFLAKIYSLPSKDIVFHRAYSNWFNLFPNYVTETPWQTYPEHVECPIKLEKKLSYQWTTSSTTWLNRLADSRKFLSLSLNSSVFTMFSRSKLYFALLCHVIGIRDYSYILNKVIKLSNN